MSVWSPKVQHITMPVPFSMLTRLSSMIFTRCPKSGTFISIPLNFWYRVSSGLNMIATQAGSSSGRVVAITTSSSFPFLCRTLNTTSLKKESISLSSHST